MKKTIATAAIMLISADTVLAEIFSYEGDSFPDQAGFVVGQNFCDPDQWVQDGCFFQFVDECPESPPPGGRQSSYERSLVEFLGSDPFFIEWKVETDGDGDQINFGAPTTFTAVGTETNYRFTVAVDLAKLNRDNLLPIVLVPMQHDSPHVLRLETFSDALYVWYIDGVIADQGIPEGPYPSGPDPFVNIRAKFYTSPSTAKWHYVRWGDLPAGGSLDFNTDGQIDDFETPFFAECMLGPGIDAGPGCRWADFDADTDVDCADRDAFINAWTGANNPPPLVPCLGPTAPIPTVSHWGVLVLILSLGIVGTSIFRRHHPSQG